MIETKKINKIVELVSRYSSELKFDLDVTSFKQGNDFSMKANAIGYTITYTDRIENKAFIKLMNEYIENNLLNKIETCFYGFNEVFALLHEIGHIATYDTIEENKEQYNYNTDNMGMIEQFYTYRQIESEKLADQFAAKVIKDNLIEIVSIMEDINEDMAINHLEFWKTMI